MQADVLEHHLIVKGNAELIDLDAAELAVRIRSCQLMRAAAVRMLFLMRVFRHFLRRVRTLAQRLDLFYHLHLLHHFESASASTLAFCIMLTS